MDEKKVKLNELRREAQGLEARLVQLQGDSDRYTNLRLASFLLGVAISAVTLLSAGIWQWLIASPVLLVPFIWTVNRHRRIEGHIIRDTTRLRLRQTQIARMLLDWEKLPAALQLTPDPEHPFANDLDLVGPCSLHHLLDSAVSREGSKRLAGWLLDTRHDSERIVGRQAQVRELVQHPQFSDDLILNATLLTTDAGEKWPGQRLLDWLVARVDGTSFRPALRLLIPLSLINITLGILDATNLLGPWWLLTWLLFVAVSFSQARKIGQLFEDAFFLQDGLDRLGRIFSFLETVDYGDNQHLLALCRPFNEGDSRPSDQLRKITRVVAAAGLKKNQVLWLWLNAIIPWDIYFAHRLNQTKQALSTLLPLWLDVWFELEALNSLAGFAALNPAAIFPEIVTTAPAAGPGSFLFEASGLGHPLIPDEQRVCNDFSVERLGAIFLITGSNMSGKSTFLRTLGVNLVLAYAGGPVIADSMKASLFRIFAVIRVSDSLVDGFSYFYAEVRRLKTLLSELEQKNELPLFYLIDEIFRGTNNRERLIGSRAYVRELARGRGIGIIATHDLELVNLADEIGEISNYHFRDDVQNGRMVFDFKLHPGPCPTTNALRIMHQAGLPVGDEG